MSLMRLLMAGRSFIGISNANSPYRLAKQNWFPKFTNSEQAGTEDVTTQPTASIVKPCLLRPQPPKTAEASSPTDTQPKSTASSERSLSQSLRAKLLPTRTTTRSIQRLKQTELKLDMVQVVRNDLSDSDLELVFKKKNNLPAKPKTILDTPTRPEANKAETPGWVARWFRTGRMNIW